MSQSLTFLIAFAKEIQSHAFSTLYMADHGKTKIDDHDGYCYASCEVITISLWTLSSVGSPTLRLPTTRCNGEAKLDVTDARGTQILISISLSSD